VISHSTRDADLPTLDQPLEPGGDIHAVSKDIVVFDHDVADIDADPEAHPSPFWLAFVRGLKRPLDLDCTADCIGKEIHGFGSALTPGLWA
jgi:hypothetical protein